MSRRRKQADFSAYNVIDRLRRDMGSGGRQRWPRSEELRLFEQRKKNRDEILRRNMGLVYKTALYYRKVSGSVSLADLIQEGSIGLLRAIDDYDPSLGYRFSTYAVWWVTHAIRRALDNQVRGIRVPVHKLDLWRRMRIQHDRLTAVLGREPTLDEIAAATRHTDTRQAGVTAEELRVVQEQVGMASAPRTEVYQLSDEAGQVRTAPALIAADDQPEEAYSQVEQEHKLRQCMGQLPDIDRDVLERRFGLNGYGHAQTLVEASAAYGVSRERIRQIEECALMELRRLLNGEQLSAKAKARIRKPRGVAKRLSPPPPQQPPEPASQFTVE